MLCGCLSDFWEKKRYNGKFWDHFPRKVQMKVIGLLTVKEKVKFSMTSKSVQKLTKRVPTPIYSLQYSQRRQSNPRIQIIVNYDENPKNYEIYNFMVSGVDGNFTICTKERHDHDEVLRFSKNPQNSDYKKWAETCFYGWINLGLSIQFLDIRGDYTGKMPDATLKVANFSFNEKSGHAERSEIPKWLNVISQEGAVNFSLMSDRWEQFLDHPHFRNSESTCKLTGYDPIPHNFVEQINCRQIQLDHIIKETAFNLMAHKWASGGYPDDFENFSCKNISCPYKTDKLLEGLLVRRLGDNLLNQFDFLGSIEQVDISIHHFLIIGKNGRIAVFTGLGYFARLVAVTDHILEKVPEFAAYLKDYIEMD